MTVATALNYAPLPGCDFGRVVTGFDPAAQTPETMKEIEDALYRVRGSLWYSIGAVLMIARCSRVSGD